MLIFLCFAVHFKILPLEHYFLLYSVVRLNSIVILKQLSAGTKLTTSMHEI